MIDPELGDMSRLSRAELEPVLAARLRAGELDGAAVIAEELESRTWQNLNPYADA